MEPANPRKGIILAGGTGTRLWPLTAAVNKHLLPVYDKPMVYYPLATLMLAGIREILLVSTPADQQAFRRLLGDGKPWGIRIDYAVQAEPRGLADGLLVGAEFLAGDPVAMILGDNLFYGHGLPQLLRRVSAEIVGATILASPVSDPQRYGIVRVSASGAPLEIEEKPRLPHSNLAVTGLYFLDAEAVSRAAHLEPSTRGELEITDLLRDYLASNRLRVETLGRGFSWFDTGTPDSLLQAANFVETLQQRQGMRIASPEEIAFRLGWIDRDQVGSLAMHQRNEYGCYLKSIAGESGRSAE